MSVARLSVITPSYNQGPFLERAIRSVLDQGYENLEYMVVDGGSTDGSREIIEGYSDRLAWWVSEPDKGQTDALNKALRRVSGEIVAFINSDDYYLPGAFARARAAFDATGASWVAGAARFMDDEGRTVRIWTPRPPPRSRYRWFIPGWSTPQPSTFWRREVFEHNGLFREDLHYAFDSEFAMRLAFAGEMPALIDDELSVRFLHGEAKSADRTEFVRERRRFVDIFGSHLPLGDRVLLRARLRFARGRLRPARADPAPSS